MKTFASDNYAGVHPLIMQALVDSNQGHHTAYGGDEFTKKAKLLLKKEFGEDSESFFVYNGTGANVLALKSITQPHHAILCTEWAHINVDEAGAPEHFTGCKLMTVPSEDGKLTIEALKKLQIEDIMDVCHHSQPKVISISQTTEFGTLYQPEEIKALADFAHEKGMLLHMDGARISNAAAALNLPFKVFTTDLGVDILSFGGSKNGMMFGEAVVFLGLNRSAQNCPAIEVLKQGSADFPFIRKNGMQLHSKMHFIAAQYLAYFQDELWRKSAENANQMTELLKLKVEELIQKEAPIKLTQKVDANALFVELPTAWIEPLQKHFPFYIWQSGKERSEVRWMCSFDSTEKEIEAFTVALQELSFS
jgi:threonine aldolase